MNGEADRTVVLATRSIGVIARCQPQQPHRLVELELVRGSVQALVYATVCSPDRIGHCHTIPFRCWIETRSCVKEFTEQ